MVGMVLACGLFYGSMDVLEIGNMWVRTHSKISKHN